MFGINNHLTTSNDGLFLDDLDKHWHNQISTYKCALNTLEYEQSQLKKKLSHYTITFKYLIDGCQLILTEKIIYLTRHGNNKCWWKICDQNDKDVMLLVPCNFHLQKCPKTNLYYLHCDISSKWMSLTFHYFFTSTNMSFYEFEHLLKKEITSILCDVDQSNKL